jgi:hypothetical protein
VIGRADKILYAISWLTLLFFFYTALAFVHDRVAPGNTRLLLYLVVVGLWANAANVLSNFKRLLIIADRERPRAETGPA